MMPAQSAQEGLCGPFEVAGPLGAPRGLCGACRGVGEPWRAGHGRTRRPIRSLSRAHVAQLCHESGPADFCATTSAGARAVPGSIDENTPARERRLSQALDQPSALVHSPAGADTGEIKEITNTGGHPETGVPSQVRGQNCRCQGAPSFTQVNAPSFTQANPAESVGKCALTCGNVAVADATPVRPLLHVDNFCVLCGAPRCAPSFTQHPVDNSCRWGALPGTKMPPPEQAGGGRGRRVRSMDPMAFGDRQDALVSQVKRGSDLAPGHALAAHLGDEIDPLLSGAFDLGPEFGCSTASLTGLVLGLGDCVSDRCASLGEPVRVGRRHRRCISPGCASFCMHSACCCKSASRPACQHVRNLLPRVGFRSSVSPDKTRRTPVARNRWASLVTQVRTVPGRQPHTGRFLNHTRGGEA